MNFYGLIDELLAYIPTHTSGQRPERDLRAADSLEDILGAKVQGLSDILTNIQHEIKTRAHLSHFVLAHMDTNYCYLKSKLFELYRWPQARDRIVEQRRLGIEKLLDALNKEKRDELTQCWQDIARLKSEFRTWLKQYSDLLQRARLMTRGAEPSKNI